MLGIYFFVELFCNVFVKRTEPSWYSRTKSNLNSSQRFKSKKIRKYKETTNRFMSHTYFRNCFLAGKSVTFCSKLNYTFTKILCFFEKNKKKTLRGYLFCRLLISSQPLALEQILDSPRLMNAQYSSKNVFEIKNLPEAPHPFILIKKIWCSVIAIDFEALQLHCPIRL